jgi:hypothetical protein
METKTDKFARLYVYNDTIKVIQVYENDNVIDTYIHKTYNKKQDPDIAVGDIRHPNKDKFNDYITELLNSGGYNRVNNDYMKDFVL